MNSVRKYDDLSDEERVHFWRAYNERTRQVTMLHDEMAQKRETCWRAKEERGSVNVFDKIRDWSDFWDEITQLRDDIDRRIEMINDAFEAFSGLSMADQDDDEGNGSA